MCILALEMALGIFNVDHFSDSAKTRQIVSNVVTLIIIYKIYSIPKYVRVSFRSNTLLFH